MAPDQRGEMGDVIVADIHAVQPDLANGLLHIDGVPMHDDIESEAKGAKLLFLPLLKRASDLAAFAVMNASAKAVTQFRMVELGQNAPPERHRRCSEECGLSWRSCRFRKARAPRSLVYP